jgi:hypothetical protein
MWLPGAAVARKSKILRTSCFRQILGDRLPDEERRPLGPVAVVGQDIGEVLCLEIDGYQGDISGDSYRRAW